HLLISGGLEHTYRRPGAWCPPGRSAARSRRVPSSSAPSGRLDPASGADVDDVLVEHEVPAGLEVPGHLEAVLRQEAAVLADDLLPDQLLVPRGDAEGPVVPRAVLRHVHHIEPGAGAPLLEAVAVVDALEDRK